jgi:hypothetical protein
MIPDALKTKPTKLKLPVPTALPTLPPLARSLES